MQKSAYAACGLVLLTAGCAATYRVDPGTPSAGATFTKGYESHYPDLMASQFYSISDNPQCTPRRSAATLTWTDADTKNTRLASGSRIVIIAETSFFHNTVFTRGVSLCADAASFVPEDSHEYSVVQHAAYQRACPLSIVDKATDKPPPSLQAADRTYCGVD